MESKTITTSKGTKYNFYRIPGYDTNGNARYVVSWLMLGLDRYDSTDVTRRAGLRIYKGRMFGGGFSFQSGNLKESAEFFESLGLMTPFDRKERNQAIQKYVLDCINYADYAVELDTDKDKILWLIERFRKDYDFAGNRKYYGNNLQEMFIGWMNGVPSVFNVDFENHAIIEHCQVWFNAGKPASERKQQQWLKQWYAGIYMAFRALCKKNKVQFELN